LSVSKTIAVWFCNNSGNLAPIGQDPNLDCSNQFRLLGIMVTNNLQLMQINFDLRLKEIGNVFNSWVNKNLTVNGKIFVIKPLGLL